MAKKARDRKRQTKINFSPATKSSPIPAMGATSSKSAEATPTRASRSKNKDSARPSSSKLSRPTAIYSSSEDELAEETHRSMTLGMPVTYTQKGMFGSSDADGASSDSSEDEHRAKNHQVKAKLASRKRRRASDSSEAGDSAEKIPVTKTKRRRQKSPEAESSEEEELRLPQNKRRKAAKRIPITDEEEESDQVKVAPARTRNRRAAQPHSSSEEEKTPPPSRQRRASRQQPIKEESDEPSPPRSTRRRLARRPTTPSEGEGDSEEEAGTVQNGDNETDEDDGEEKEDLKEDLAFLRSSPLPDRGKLRSAHDKPKNERQKALEALKKRRAGTNEPSSSATPNRNRRVIIESGEDSDSELEIIKEEPESDDDDMSEPDNEEEEGGSDHEPNALDMFYEDDDDEAFIDNDADALIGEPILNPDDFMPLIMSRLSSSKPKELFKYAIEWMVMKKIHPAFDSKSEVYTLTFRKLDDEVKGLANSKFSSSAWTSDFTRALRARPDLTIMEITRTQRDIMDAHCEACNRRNHPASDELMFTGKPYNQETLEPLDTNSDSDSDNTNSDSDSVSDLSDSEVGSNGEKPERDAQGARIPPESKTFTLGSTCKANAQVAHTLHHWRYHLYSWVKDYLAREGHLTAEKLVQRDGWTNKKREKASLKIVKKMEASGEIRKLYVLYKDQMKYASEVRHDLNRGWRSRE